MNINELDTFTRAYIECALWSSSDSSDAKKRAAKEAGYTVDMSQLNKAGKPLWAFAPPGENAGEWNHQFNFEDEAWEGAFEHMGGRSCDESLDAHYTASDIAPETLERMVKDCERFQREAVIAPYFKEAGHDFWLTRNGHGSGFWDGDWPDSGEELTAISKTFGEYDLYVGDDGAIYGS
jgi:hypothetical protein